MSYIKQLTKINLGKRMIHSTRDEQKAAAVLLQDRVKTMQ